MLRRSAHFFRSAFVIVANHETTRRNLFLDVVELRLTRILLPLSTRLCHL